MDDKSNNSLDNSLETPETGVNGAPVGVNQATSITVKTSLWQKIVKKLSFLNIYLALFILLVVLAVIITYAGIRNNTKVEQEGQINSQDLTSQGSDSISDNNTVVGDPKQTLTIASDSVFNGKVLFRDNIDVAGAIKVGGALSLPGITVSGNSAFENVSISNGLIIGGDTVVNGNLTIQKSLTVSGGASFGGAISASQLVIDRLTLNQDIQLNRHLKTGGSVPGVSPGGAAGGGGTASISGNDTAGTVTINVGGSPAAGILASITFVNSFEGDPRVVITPIGSPAGSLDWYITRISNGYRIETTSAPSASSSFSFNYIVFN